MYTQALVRIRSCQEARAAAPGVENQAAVQGVLEGDMKTVGASGMKGLMEIIMATHSGMTAAEFEQEVIRATGWRPQSNPSSNALHRMRLSTPA